MSPTGPSRRSGAGVVLALPQSLPWRSVLRDLVVVAAWVVVVSFVFRTLGWPTWAYYAVAFGGVLAYSLAGDPWSSRSDD